MEKIYIDKTRIEYNDRRAYPILKSMAETGYEIVYGIDPLNDPQLAGCTVVGTNSRQHAEEIADGYPLITVFLIQRPLNKDYKSTRKNLQTVWCWDDFQFFVYFPTVNQRETL